MHPYFAPRKRAELYPAVVADHNINGFFSVGELQFIAEASPSRDVYNTRPDAYHNENYALTGLRLT